MVRKKEALLNMLCSGGGDQVNRSTNISTFGQEGRPAVRMILSTMLPF